MFDTTSKTYMPVNNTIHESFSVSFSDCISVAKSCNDITLTSRLKMEGTMADSIGIIAIVGIEFFKEENGIMYNLQAKNCMKVGEVF